MIAELLAAPFIPTDFLFSFSYCYFWFSYLRKSLDQKYSFPLAYPNAKPDPSPLEPRDKPGEAADTDMGCLYLCTLFSDLPSATSPDIKNP